MKISRYLLIIHSLVHNNPNSDHRKI